jgi:hypothetical protein
MREYFSGNYVPGAGTATHQPAANNIQSTTSVVPDQVGVGTTTGQPADPYEPSSFDQSTVSALQASGIQSFGQSFGFLGPSVPGS